jgi:hypothetical protein
MKKEIERFKTTADDEIISMPPLNLAARDARPLFT